MSGGGFLATESARLSFFFSEKEIYFSCLSSLLSKKDKRHTTYLRGGAPFPGPGGDRDPPTELRRHPPTSAARASASLLANSRAARNPGRSKEGRGSAKRIA